MSSARWKHFERIFSHGFQIITIAAAAAAVATRWSETSIWYLLFFLPCDEMHVKTSAWACGQDVAEEISRSCSSLCQRQRRWWKCFRLDYFYHNSARVFELTLVGFHRGKFSLPSLPPSSAEPLIEAANEKIFGNIFSREGRACGGRGREIWL